MTALIIIAAIALLLCILLFSSVTAELEYDETFKFKIKYLFFTIAKDPLSPKEQKKKKRREEKKKRKAEKKKRRAEKSASLTPKNKNTGKHVNVGENRENTGKTNENIPQKQENGKGKTAKENAQKKEKKKSGITPDIIMRIFGKAKPHIKRLFKKIRISGVYTDITVGGEDAAKTAISYGIHCAAVDGLAGFLNSTVSFKAEKITIRADFDLEKTEYYARGTVKLRLSTLLHSSIWGFFAVKNELMQIANASEKAPAPPADRAA